MSKAKRELKLIKEEIELNVKAVEQRRRIQKYENDKELEMLDKFEKWTRNLNELLDKELTE